MKQTLSPDIGKLLHDLQPEQQTFTAPRIAAVKELGELSASNIQVVNALIVVMESDPTFLVRKKAREALQAPAHQEILEQHPDLMKKVLEMQDPYTSQSTPPKAATLAGQLPTKEVLFQPPLDRPQERERGMRGIGDVIIGAIFIVGGLSGKLVFRGTNSSELLALVGVGLVGWGIYKFANQE